ncbi:hypothetical protein EDC18_10850 [Natranaerovirga pectinivora]|uniref:Uncharacterized protein n=1 Tax=Natranaerovirga pectinivora TaxID=682400 RepID=A0A4R3MJF4_9FIRM|nr:hypothetical protein [Natranaerovirga pectinivora]TCT13815.1 hypothetical protein EDC18_10850 [Natranaerovirga pectinivora]
MKKHPLWLNIYLVIGIIISFFALIKSYIDKINLPPNVCPIEKNNNILYLGIFLLISYLVIAFGYDWYNKNIKSSN